MKPSNKKKTNHKPKKKVLQSEYDFQAVSAYIAEYFNCFLLIGYDCDGNAIHLLNTHNQQEYNALSVSVRDYLYDQSQSQINPPPED